MTILPKIVLLRNDRKSNIIPRFLPISLYMSCEFTIIVKVSYASINQPCLILQVRTRSNHLPRTSWCYSVDRASVPPPGQCAGVAGESSAPAYGLALVALAPGPDSLGDHPSLFADDRAAVGSVWLNHSAVSKRDEKKKDERIARCTDWLGLGRKRICLRVTIG